MIKYLSFSVYPGGSAGKESACNVGDLGLIPGLGRSSGEGKGYLLQYSCLEDSMDRGDCLGTVYGVSESDTTEWLTLSRMKLEWNHIVHKWETQWEEKNRSQLRWWMSRIVTAWPWDELFRERARRASNYHPKGGRDMFRWQKIERFAFPQRSKSEGRQS